MRNDLVPFGGLPDAWRQTVHGVSMSKDEFTMACEIEDEIRSEEESALMHSIRIGSKLIRFKEALGHGRFGVWQRCRFGEVGRTCQRHMLIAKHFGDHPNAISHLSLTLVRQILEKRNRNLLENQIKPEINEGKKLEEERIRALLPGKPYRPPRVKAAASTFDSEEEIVSVMVHAVRKCGEPTLSIIKRMDQNRLGEMIIGRVITGT